MKTFPPSVAKGDPRLDRMIGRLKAIYRRMTERRLKLAGRAMETRIRHAFKKMDGHHNAFGVWIPGVWPKVASKLLELNCEEPERFVAAQFERCRIPFENELLGDKAWANYQSFTRMADERLKCKLQSDAISFDKAWMEVTSWFPDFDSHQKTNYILVSSIWPISAVFRYALAVAEGLEPLSRMLEPSAINEYLTDPHGYDRVWRERVPEKLRSDAWAEFNQ